MTKLSNTILATITCLVIAYQIFHWQERKARENFQKELRRAITLYADQLEELPPEIPNKELFKLLRDKEFLKPTSQQDYPFTYTINPDEESFTLIFH